MAAASNMKRNYHVFLSFRGIDVRHNFFSHLYVALDQKGIHTFFDSEELRKGEEISPTLMRAIEDSRIAIIIFSENYASSPWCLEEVVKIMECKEQSGLIVFPVFYKVEPREVRRGRKSYGRAMAKLESKFGKDSEKVKRWKKALFEAGSLSGYEANLIQCIVKELLIRLDRTPLHVAKYPVGIDPRVEELISLSQKESVDDDDVLMIGLWGLGGIGKTTIAKALFNAIERQFHGCSFLAQVRETSKSSNGLVALQKTLLSEILSQRDLTVNCIDRGINLIRERLCCRKVLLVLDDVDQSNQLNALAGEGNWFGKGSRIIITSRDKHLLTCHSKHFVYEVHTLEFNEALDLFCRHAFPNSERVEIRRNLIYRVVQYASCLPLALEVLGSFLRGREESAWESTLHKLSKLPEQTINEDIVNQECGNDPRKRSRLWLFEDFQDILCANTEMNAVKAIILDLPRPKEITINPNTFSNMKMLKVLILLKVHISSEDPIRLPNELRYLKWHNASNLEFGFGPKKLKRLDVQGSHIRQLGGNFQNFMRLKSIKFSECNSLASVPDLSCAPNLDSLNFDGCKNLVEVHQSIGCLENLKFLCLDGCPNLSIFPNLLKTKSLQILGLSSCSKLEKFPDILGKMGHLKFLKLQETAIKELPVSIENLVSVNKIELAFCENLARLPSSIYRLKNLQTLSIENCSNLVMFPKSMKDSTDPGADMVFQNLYCLILNGCNLLEVEFLESSSSFPKLDFLNLSNNKFTHLPTSINKYNNLSYLVVRKCKQLQEIPKLPPNLFYLEANNCKSLQKLPNLSGRSFKKLTVELSSCSELLHKGVNFANASLLEMKEVDIIQSGREMPEWIHLCSEESASFMIPQDLYEKFLGLAICVVLASKDRKKVVPTCKVNIFVNCQKVFEHTRYLLHASESDIMWLCYYPLSELIEVSELLQNDWIHIRVGIKASKGRLKKYGFRLICEQPEDDMRVVFPAPSADISKLEYLWKDFGEYYSTDTMEEDSSIESYESNEEESSSSPLAKKIRSS
ncbi:hypothetical protein BT93_L4133 [Corymbia citriodora subsp. variegata]|uniref:ADP-ribosyl cyclase/cyclic ADP-ribose hydrolase n=1 Tax=Corymbia citriodora subsp. variegata TaxID=360336 RepID=A0A8T0CZ12_CORYI|nr:hypothetical protein BT93_L4133 [Corymbia citriodora subsp. variegata]